MRSFLIKSGLTALFVVAAMFCGQRNAKADIIDLNFVTVPFGQEQVFLQAEEWWEERFQGFSRSLPKYALLQLRPIEIDITVEEVDGPGGVLGFAAPTEFFRMGGRGGSKGTGAPQITITQAGEMTFDEEDWLLNSGLDNLATAIHEIGHILGIFTTPAEEMNLVVEGLDRRGGNAYVGANGLAGYRKMSSNPFAAFAPLEKRGGGGSRDGHPDFADPFIRQSNDIMGAFANETFIRSLDDIRLSEFTYGTMLDLYFDPEGVVYGDNDLGPNRPKNGGENGGGGPPAARSASVPEPASAGLIGIVSLAGLCLVRRRRK